MPKKINPSALLRVNKACSYFPCHHGLEDCAFCYCPFYPCKDEFLGRFLWPKKLKRNIWSCQDCVWIHKKKTVDRIYKLIGLNQAAIKKDVPPAYPGKRPLKEEKK